MGWAFFKNKNVHDHVGVFMYACENSYYKNSKKGNFYWLGKWFIILDILILMKLVDVKLIESIDIYMRYILN